jgi:NitT/TauT family transport system permease protein
MHMEPLKKNLNQKVQNNKFGAWVFRRIILPIIPFVGVIAIWEILARNFQPDLLPAPMVVAKATIELAKTGLLLNNIIASLTRVFSGFLLATICAIPLGIILGWYKRAGNTFSPLIEVFRTISPISWIPLAILWFGIGDLPAIFIIFITSFFPLLIATIHACRQIDPVLLRVAKNFGANGRKLFLHVILPASFPYIIIGLRISLGISWVVIVAAEMVGMRSGLGYLIMDARNFLRTDFVMAGMVTIGIIGFMIDRIMLYLEKQFEKHKTRLEDV